MDNIIVEFKSKLTCIFNFKVVILYPDDQKQPDNIAVYVLGHCEDLKEEVGYMETFYIHHTGTLCY